MEEPILEVSEDYDAEFNVSEALVVNAVSPHIGVEERGGNPAVHRINITDVDGSRHVDISDGAAAGFGTPTASVDANIGTPSVAVTASGSNTSKVFDFAFHNLKGETGDAAGFGTVSASVDSNVGTPSVNVTTSGANTAKNLNFAFSNVKGETGDAAGFGAVNASVDSNTGTPSVGVSASGPDTAKQFTFQFHNLKGETGATGPQGPQGPAGSPGNLTTTAIETNRGDGVVAGPIQKAEAKGWAEQFSTTGKNLCPRMTDTELHGVTITALNDGRLLITGESDSNVFTFPLPSMTLSAGTYTLSGCPSGGGASSYRMDVRVDNVAIDSSTDSGSGATFTISEETTCKVHIRIGAQYAFPTGGVIFAIQLELGSTATFYEPYTGGAPSPSPDYPQEIKVAKGRNLFDENNWVRQSSYPTLYNDYYYSDPVYLKPNATYTISLGDYTSLSSAMYYAMKVYNTDGITSPQDNGTVAYLFGENVTGRLTAPYTFVAGSSGVIRFAYKNASILDLIEARNIQLELGSVATPYVPYGYVGLEVQGKNLFDYTNIQYSGKYLNSVGEIASNGGWNIAKPIEVVPSTSYTISGKPSEDNTVHCWWYDKSMTQISGFKIGSKTVTSPSDAKYLVMSFDNNWKTNIQLELGSTATDYEPYYHYTTPIPLPERGWVGALPDGTADKLILDSAGKVEWEKRTEETDQATTDGVSATIGTTALSTTNSLADGAMVLYKLATPVTEDLGYITLPNIPVGATLSIPELDELNVEYWLDDAIFQTQQDQNEMLRNKDIPEIEDAIGDLATLTAELIQHDMFYFGLHEYNGEKYISVFRRSDA